MEGKTVVVTGANSGIGLETARALAEMGARVVMVCRNAKRASAARDDIMRTATGPVDIELADFASLSSVRTLAPRLLERYPRIDVLVSNAGVFRAGHSTTADGFESTFAVNHLAPFLLTNLLLDRLRSSAARVVVVSSIAHFGATLPADPLTAKSRGWRAYQISKLANVLFTYGVSRRLDGTGVTANCLHPGLVRSHLGSGNKIPVAPIWWLLRPFTVSAREGAKTSVYLASSPAVDSVSQQYFESCRAVPSSGPSYDAAEQDRLWELSAKATGIA